ncbi:hypothetical protein MIB92_12155 [Aestuariirhabdus sp. Z084]|uniref:DUF1127 domain-containing protein n=1 Tax=Aestuariirhabdus haliotis TaxID=2918751 RepID=UPI00201B3E18|nr:hypothetical protein [Aestuariirhabdus haliotis]MCL6416406.1 hypothetical protein [Aestuariirhabdus haliotis]MCL6420428.1 hypothetical protein [Aestuariirhabdus haliotis]
MDIFTPLQRAVNGARATLARYHQRARSRRYLAELAQQPHLLKDLGLTYDQAMQEAHRPPWQSMQYRVKAQPTQPMIESPLLDIDRA